MYCATGVAEEGSAIAGGEAFGGGAFGCGVGIWVAAAAYMATMPATVSEDDVDVPVPWAVGG